MPLDGLEPLTRPRTATVPDLADVTVWIARLDLEAAALAGCAAVLSPDELSRAGRYSRTADRDRFIAGRGQLRHLLGRCLDLAPAAIRFANAPFGKPSLAGESGASSVNFSASRSDATGLIAVRRGAEVGVDVEAIRPIADCDRLSQRLLSQAERAEYMRLPEARHGLRFLEYWVRKEAAAKSLGTGLAEGFDRLSLSPWQASGTFHLEVPRENGPANAWVSPVPLPGAGYVGAVASSRPFDGIDVRRWGESVAG